MRDNPRALIQRSVFHHVAWDSEYYVEHSPTQKKFWKYVSIKRGKPWGLCVTAPNNSPGPTNPWAHHVPARYSTCQVGATQASAWTRVALPCVCATSAPRKRPLGLRGSAMCPTSRHISPRFLCELTPFLPFFKGIKIRRNQNKFQKNSENLEINIFKNITPFWLKFSPLDHKFLHLYIIPPKKT